jgi:hypothetical protein
MEVGDGDSVGAGVGEDQACLRGRAANAHGCFVGRQGPAVGEPFCGI